MESQGPMAQKQIQTVGQYQAAYFETGSSTDAPEAPTLLFLHGFLGESSLWQPLMEQLSYRCIALDLLGFGESSKPRLKYTIWHQTEFLQGFIEALQLRQLILVGHSYGGWTSAAYAIEQSTQLDGLVLLAPAGIRDDSFVGRYDYMRPILWETPAVDWILAAIRPVAYLLGQGKTYRQVAMARREFSKQPVAKSFIVDRLRPEDAIDTVEQEIHHIEAPTLVIAGQEDSTIPLWHCETYGRDIPNARLEVLPDTDHDLIRTRRPRIAELITGFVNAAV